MPGRGDYTHLALAALDHDGRSATPVGHVGSAMLRGLANAHGFVVVRPGTRAAAGDLVPFLPLPLLAGRTPMTVTVVDVGDQSARPGRARSGGRPTAGPARSCRSRAWSATTTTAAAVTLLEYEGHPSAETVLREVAEEIAADPDVYAVAVSHRVGTLRIGDVALVAAVSTAHRAAAFAACARLVDEAKARLPIWKRQVFADGTDEWVNCP